MSFYNTKQRSTIVAFFENHQERGFTPDEVAIALPEVPKSTVYRLITQLSNEGFLRKTGNSGRRAIFQYQSKECSGHMHIRCRLCGRIEHLDPVTTRKIETLVEVSSGFVALDTTIFEGLCMECRGK